LVFEKIANFFAENWGNSPKIVIIKSTPGAIPTTFELTITYNASVACIRLERFLHRILKILKTRQAIT
jgi:hypothetical protein